MSRRAGVGGRVCMKLVRKDKRFQWEWRKFLENMLKLYPYLKVGLDKTLQKIEGRNLPKEY